MSFFKNLQEKDRVTQANFAFVVAVGISGIIGLVWLTTLPARFASIAEVEEIAATESESPETNMGDSFGSIASGVRSQAASLGDAFKGLAKTFTQAEQEVPGVSTLDTSAFYTPSEVTEEMSSEGKAPTATTSVEYATTTPKIDKAERIILIGTTTTETRE